MHVSFICLFITDSILTLVIEHVVQNSLDRVVTLLTCIWEKLFECLLGQFLYQLGVSMVFFSPSRQVLE
jgi:hypothetical protein